MKCPSRGKKVSARPMATISSGSAGISLVRVRGRPTGELPRMSVMKRNRSPSQAYKSGHEPTATFDSTISSGARRDSIPIWLSITPLVQMVWTLSNCVRPPRPISTGMVLAERVTQKLPARTSKCVP